MRYGLARTGLVLRGSQGYCTVLHGKVFRGMVRSRTAESGLVRLCAVGQGLLFLGMVWHGDVRRGGVLYGKVNFAKFSTSHFMRGEGGEKL